jgi:hypothetical protein
MPVVTVPPRPNGLPTAITGWPTRTLVASAKVTNGSGLSLSTLIKARSVLSSPPTILAGSLRPSARVTVIESALPATWKLVTIQPLASTMKPVPTAWAFWA